MNCNGTYKRSGDRGLVTRGPMRAQGWGVWLKPLATRPGGVVVPLTAEHRHSCISLPRLTLAYAARSMAHTSMTLLLRCSAGRFRRRPKMPACYLYICCTGALGAFAPILRPATVHFLYSGRPAEPTGLARAVDAATCRRALSRDGGEIVAGTALGRGLLGRCGGRRAPQNVTAANCRQILSRNDIHAKGLQIANAPYSPLISLVGLWLQFPGPFQLMRGTTLARCFFVGLPCGAERVDDAIREAETALGVHRCSGADGDAAHVRGVAGGRAGGDGDDVGQCPLRNATAIVAAQTVNAAQ